MSCDPDLSGTWRPPGSAANEDAGPVFRLIAAQIENAIVDRSLAEETQVPSSDELAALPLHQPAAAAKTSTSW
jgi:DNA-binding transcriptional regulator YhcF (GntR family)